MTWGESPDREGETVWGGGGGRGGGGGGGHRIKANNGDARPLPLGRNCRFWSHLAQRVQKGGEKTFLPLK